MNTETHTEITAENLIAAGYRAFPASSIERYADMLYQKRIQDEGGIRYFVNFKHYPAEGNYTGSFQCDVCCNTDSEGYAWMQFKEDTLEKAEHRAYRLWDACGRVYYEAVTE